MTSSDQRDAMRDLIPLYLNGTLRGPERARFELRVQHDIALRRELDEFAEIEAAFQEMEDRVGVDLQRVFRRVQETIHRTASGRERSAHPTSALLTWLKEIVLTPAVGWSVAAAQLAVIAILIMGTPHREPAPAETLSESGARMQPELRRIHVVFAPNATQQEVQQLLTSAGVRISDGPTAVGGFTLEIQPRQGRTAADVLQMLRASPIVVFADFAY